jgi:hypothetical protein
MLVGLVYMAEMGLDYDNLLFLFLSLPSLLAWIFRPTLRKID